MIYKLRIKSTKDYNILKKADDLTKVKLSEENKISADSEANNSIHLIMKISDQVLDYNIIASSSSTSESKYMVFKKKKPLIRSSKSK